MTFVVRRGDTRRALEVVLTGPTGAPVDLTGATVRFYMRPKGGTTNKVDGALAIIADAALGKVWYVWTSADVDIPNVYFAYFAVVFPDGKHDSYPSDVFLDVEVTQGFA